MFDYDQDGWPDLLVANDTQPNKLYRNLHNGKFKDVAVEAGLAFSTEGKARAGMGVDTGELEGSGKSGIAITNFDNEMIGLYRATSPGVFDDISIPSGVGSASISMAVSTSSSTTGTLMKPFETSAATSATRNHPNFF